MEETYGKDSRYARSLIEASLDPLVTISKEGKITDVNDAMAKVTGVVRKELIGTDFGIYFTEPEKARKVYKEVFEKGFVANHPLIIKDGKLTDVLFNGSVYKNAQGDVLGAVVVARDMTEQKRNEKVLTEAKNTAENATKAKQQFLSNMSHEIRTPMNAIIGFTKLVLRTDLSTKQKEYLRAIETSGDTLIVIINDILDLAKVNEGKITFSQTPFKLALSVRAMIHLFEAKIQEKNLELVKEYDNKIPEVLIGDPVRLNQIILNLISNAVKFTTKGRITVSVRLLNEDEEKATIEFVVRDTGIGIPKDKTEKIFESFEQVSDDTSKLYGGTGLGLAIVKQLVEPQGGKISVESKINEGSTFSVILSFQKTKVMIEQDAETEEVNTEIKDIKILVVEDVPLNQLLMKALLDDFGFEYDIAGNGRIAIEKLKAKSYDIILMDLHMPEMDGFETTEYIRGKLNSTIPIIALTADVTTVDLAKCKAVGMNDYITKPVDEKLLHDKIAELVKKRAQFKSNIRESENRDGKKLKYTDLSFLLKLTKTNPKLMKEMISVYLEQTPPLVNVMKQSTRDKDWASLNTAVHKMIPSFSIVGISTDFESMARKVQEYAKSQQIANEIPNLVLQIGNACTHACNELEEEFVNIEDVVIK